MEILENNTGFDTTSVFGIAGRENNKKRSHLLVNFLQGKHVPVCPSDSLALFSRLGDLVADRLKGQKVLVVGFAETATAIGAAVATRLPQCLLYVHTSREKVGLAERIVDFNEEHSHAVEQILFCHDWEAYASQADCILFVEDEITTGKTILNFIQALKETNRVPNEMHFVVASLLNGMDEAAAENFRHHGVEYYYLMRLMCSDFSSYLLDVPTVSHDIDFTAEDSNELSIMDLKGRLDTRTGIEINSYNKKIDELSNEMMNSLNLAAGDVSSVLVLGTEEFMYPAIYSADKIATLLPKAEVFVHATTRSPIIAFEKESYPLQSRYRLRSLYEAERRTFIYNLRAYQKVIVLTDATGSTEGMCDLVGALRVAGCVDISIVRWTE